jgi:DNA-binding NarL/FixJ family response regulator
MDAGDALRVLVVDDDPDQRRLVRFVLGRHERFDVVAEAGDGAAAVRLTDEKQPDLVLLDLSMPVMGGLEAIPRIKAVCPTARIVVFSHFPRARAAPAVLEAGVAGYIEKSTPASRLADEILMASGLLDTVSGAISQFDSRFPPELRSAPSARRFVNEALRRWDCADLLDVVQLLTSEIVTNAIVHAGTALDVRVSLLTDRVRVEVHDFSPADPEQRQADVEDTSGRGIALVDTLARSWGTDRRPEGKTVWFEVDRPELREP